MDVGCWVLGVEKTADKTNKTGVGWLLARQKERKRKHKIANLNKSRDTLGVNLDSIQREREGGARGRASTPAPAFLLHGHGLGRTHAHYLAQKMAAVASASASSPTVDAVKTVLWKFVVGCEYMRYVWPEEDEHALRCGADAMMMTLRSPVRAWILLSCEKRCSKWRCFTFTVHTLPSPLSLSLLSFKVLFIRTVSF